jgi:hypothetical protein
MPNNLIDSLGSILNVDTLPVLKILVHISQRQKFTDKTLSALSESLISADDDLIRAKTLSILEEQMSKFDLKDNLKYLVKLEEEARILSSD